MNRVSLVMFAAVLSFSACKKDDNNNNSQPKAKVMFVNAAMDVGDSLRVQVNNQTIRTIPFLGNTGYVEVDPGTSSKISFVFTGSGNVFQEATINLTADNYYSVFTGGNANTRTIASKTDNFAAVAGKAKIRFVQLSPGSLSVDASVGNTTVVNDMNFGAVSEYVEVDAGTYTITAGDPAQISTIRNLSGQILTAGKFYTYLFTGTSGATGTFDLKLTSIVNK